MAKKLTMPRQTLRIFLTELEEIRRTTLTADENAILDMKIDGASDRAIAIALEMSTPAVNHKKRNLYKLIRMLVWWKYNEEPILDRIEAKLSEFDADIFYYIARRKTQKEIKDALKCSTWKINKSINQVFEIFSGDRMFRRFFKSLKLGYKIPKKGGDKKMGDDEKFEPSDPTAETEEAPVRQADESPAGEDDEKAVPETETPDTPEETPDTPEEKASEETGVSRGPAESEGSER